MRKLVYFIIAITIISCQNEPKDYVTFSGKITDKNSDSVVVRTRTYAKVIKVNEDGTFSDTLKVETGVYSFFDGKEQTSIFLKNGYDIKMTLDAKMFDETAKYTGTGAESSNFLAEKSLLEEKLLDVDKLSNLSSDKIDAKFNNIKKQLTDLYNTSENIDSLVINEGLKNIEPMLGFYKKHINEKIEMKKNLPKGGKSPEFTDYENYKGGTTSLKDLRGKYVYIDIWATWCGPCKAEMPALKNLEKEYHGKNITFLSISIDDDRSHKGSWEKANENWRKMVADKELGGVQLFAPKGWKSQFIKDYYINGIPRFILLDPNGNIVSPNAPRPSSSKLIEFFNKENI